MSIKRITAIVPIDILNPLEKHLRKCGVPGVTVERVQGYGEHPNYFRRDLMQDNARVLLYVDEAQVDTIVAAIVNCARECGAMAGILAVASVDRLVNLTNGDEMTSSS
jgi:nitrogen regulatory protein PII